MQNVDCGLGMKQNTTKLGVHWPHTDFNQNGSEPLNLENIIFQLKNVLSAQQS